YLAFLSQTIVYGALQLARRRPLFPLDMHSVLSSSFRPYLLTALLTDTHVQKKNHSPLMLLANAYAPYLHVRQSLLVVYLILFYSFLFRSTVVQLTEHFLPPFLRLFLKRYFLLSLLQDEYLKQTTAGTLQE